MKRKKPPGKRGGGRKGSRGGGAGQDDATAAAELFGGGKMATSGRCSTPTTRGKAYAGEEMLYLLLIKFGSVMSVFAAIKFGGIFCVFVSNFDTFKFGDLVFDANYFAYIKFCNIVK